MDSKSRSRAKVVRVAVRPISNGFIVEEHKCDSKGNHSYTEHFTDKDPVVVKRKGAVKKASGPISMRNV